MAKGIGQITLTNIQDGSDAVSALLSNESHTLQADSSGKITNYTGAETLMYVYKGLIDVTSEYTITKIESGVTGNLVNNKYTVTNVNNGVGGTVQLVATKDSFSITKTFTVAVSKDGHIGVDGEPASLVDISFDTQIFKSIDGKVFTPSTITLSPRFQTVTFSKWEYLYNNTWTVVTSGSNGLTIGTNKELTVDSTSNLFTKDITAISFRCISSNTSVMDTVTVSRLVDGSGAVQVSNTQPLNPTKDDLWLNTENNILYRFNGTEWVSMSLDEYAKLTDVDNKVSNKNKVFITEPIPPYHPGDIYIVQDGADKGKIKTCLVERLTGVYNEEDWITPLTAYTTITQLSNVLGTDPSEFSTTSTSIISRFNEHTDKIQSTEKSVASLSVKASSIEMNFSQSGSGNYLPNSSGQYGLNQYNTDTVLYYYQPSPPSYIARAGLWVPTETCLLNLCFTDYIYYEPGQYSNTDGTKVVNDNAVRLTRYVPVKAYYTYTVSSGSSSAILNLIVLNSSKQFVRSITNITNNSTVTFLVGDAFVLAYLTSTDTSSVIINNIKNNIVVPYIAKSFKKDIVYVYSDKISGEYTFEDYGIILTGTSISRNQFDLMFNSGGSHVSTIGSFEDTQDDKMIRDNLSSGSCFVFDCNDYLTYGTGLLLNSDPFDTPKDDSFNISYVIKNQTDYASVSVNSTLSSMYTNNLLDISDSEMYTSGEYYVPGTMNTDFNRGYFNMTKPTNVNIIEAYEYISDPDVSLNELYYMNVSKAPEYNLYKLVNGVYTIYNDQAVAEKTYILHAKRKENNTYSAVYNLYYTPETTFWKKMNINYDDYVARQMSITVGISPAYTVGEFPVVLPINESTAGAAFIYSGASRTVDNVQFITGRIYICMSDKYKIDTIKSSTVPTLQNFQAWKCEEDITKDGASYVKGFYYMNNLTSGTLAPITDSYVTMLLDNDVYYKYIPTRWELVPYLVSECYELNPTAKVYVIPVKGNVYVGDIMVSGGTNVVGWVPKSGENYWSKQIKFSGRDGIVITNPSGNYKRILNESSDTAWKIDGSGKITETIWKLIPSGMLAKDEYLYGSLNMGYVPSGDIYADHFMSILETKRSEDRSGIDEYIYSNENVHLYEKATLQVLKNITLEAGLGYTVTYDSSELVVGNKVKIVIQAQSNTSFEFVAYLNSVKVTPGTRAGVDYGGTYTFYINIEQINNQLNLRGFQTNG